MAIELKIPRIWTATANLRWNDAEGIIEQLFVNNCGAAAWSEAIVDWSDGEDLTEKGNQHEPTERERCVLGEPADVSQREADGPASAGSGNQET